MSRYRRRQPAGLVTHNTNWVDEFLKPHREKLVRAIERSVRKRSTSAEVTLPFSALEMIKKDLAEAGYFFTHDLLGDGTVLLTIDWETVRG